jgi:hypothetical protein
MDSDLIYPSNPTPLPALKIPFPRRFQSYEVNETDNEASPDMRDEGTSTGKSGKPCFDCG